MERGTPYRVGLTGTVAAGKSFVARRLAERGATLIDSDALARQVVRPGRPALTEIREAFGAEVFAPDGSLDRAALGRLVYDSAPARRRLEQITHPRIQERRARLLARAAAAGERVIVEDVPLLFEAGLEADYDMIVVVDAPATLREARARTARGWSAKRFADTDAAQLPASEKRCRAHRVIENDGTPEQLDAKLDDLWQEIATAAGVPRAGQVVHS